MNLLRTTSAGAHDWDLDPDESADLAESLVRLTGPVMVVDDEPMVRKSWPTPSSESGRGS